MRMILIYISSPAITAGAGLPGRYTCRVLSTQGVPVYPPVGYRGSTRWIPERIQVSVEYPGTVYPGTRRVLGYRAPDNKLPDRVPGTAVTAALPTVARN